MKPRRAVCIKRCARKVLRRQARPDYTSWVQTKAFECINECVRMLAALSEGKFFSPTLAPVHTHKRGTLEDNERPGPNNCVGTLLDSSA